MERKILKEGWMGGRNRGLRAKEARERWKMKDKKLKEIEETEEEKWRVKGGQEKM